MIKSSIYIHIPFCVKKCGYCDFLSMEAGKELQEHYVQALLREVREGKERFGKYRIVSVFFGGGTPSLLSSGQLISILECVRSCYQVDGDAEISIEMNPGTVDAKKLADYYEAGINRISIGLQSCIDAELKRLGRIHTYAQFLEQYYAAREIGFGNINVDLMSALPYQTAADYEYSLRQVMKLEPEHISAYSLIIEEGTPFYKLYGGSVSLPDEETDRKMYEMTKEILASRGYRRYEISNYAKAGYECRHNIGYWQRKNYIGMGLGSSSMVENVRWKNTSDMQTYLNSVTYEEIDYLSQNDQMEEFMFLGLRMTAGIDAAVFRDVFGVPVMQVYGKPIKKLLGEGLIEWKEDCICLTEKGLDLSNYVFVQFLLDESFFTC